ncbi:MAG TPA: RluA family pseudouridine synthase, partial [Candidatus Paceibacterota bacterium]|nr:RluA family pseudouridine synthase [Candidatus Paceibacterota bacterium]
MTRELVPTVIFEDKDILVIDKPAGLLVHPVKRTGGQWGKEPTVVSWALRRWPALANVGDAPAERPGIVHRLDRDTSGVMVIAKTQRMFEYLKGLFQRHEIKKTYLALVVGRPAKRQDVIDAPLGIVAGTTKRSVRSEKMAKPARTEYLVQRVFPDNAAGAVSLLEIRPQTGRTHQIRVHLASIGHPVVGDRIYGRRK